MIVACAAYSDGVRSATLELDEVGAWCPQDGVLVWMGLKSPSEKEFAATLRAFGLRSECRSLALDPHAHPAFTTLGPTCNLILRTAQHHKGLQRVFMGEVSLFFAEHYVVSVRFGGASPLDQVRAHLEARPELLALGTAGVLHAIIDQVVGDYIPVLHGLETEVLEVERDVFSDTPRRSSKHIYALKRQILDLYGIVDELADPLNRLIRSREPWMSDAARERFQDHDDQLSRLAGRARSLSDLLTSALDAQLTQISVQQNEDMRRISAWAAILAVPTMVAGVYGMNFEHMPELGTRYGYYVTMLVVVFACTALYRWFRRNRWL